MKYLLVSVLILSLSKLTSCEVIGPITLKFHPKEESGSLTTVERLIISEDATLNGKRLSRNNKYFHSKFVMNSGIPNVYKHIPDQDEITKCKLDAKTYCVSHIFAFYGMFALNLVYLNMLLNYTLINILINIGNNYHDIEISDVPFSIIKLINETISISWDYDIPTAIVIKSIVFKKECYVVIESLEYFNRNKKSYSSK